MGPLGRSAGEDQPAGSPEPAADAVEVLQAATRILAGLALRSVDALEGAVSLPQLRLLAMLADLGPARSGQVARGCLARVAGAGSRHLQPGDGGRQRLTLASGNTVME